MRTVEFNLEQEEKEEKKAGVAAACWTVGLTLLSGFVGYKLGYGMLKNNVNMGLHKCFETDPTLKEHLANAISNTLKDGLLKS